MRVSALAQLCLDFLGSLAVCFSSHFARALEQRSEQREASAGGTASLATRHVVVGVCCLYDFGFVSPRLFVELIWRISGLRRGSKAVDEHNIELSDFRIELLLLLLRLGGEKLRHDDTSLFTNTWKELVCLVQRQDNSRPQHLAVLKGDMGEAGKTLQPAQCLCSNYDLLLPENEDCLTVLQPICVVLLSPQAV